MKKAIKFKRILSGVLSAVMTVSAVPIVSTHAEESTEPYPYTMFAASSDEGAITVNAGNFCVNGNVATNGTIVSSGNVNVNGTKTESAEESMIFIFDRIDNRYFSASNVDEHDEDYILDEMNININVPTEVQGEATLTGNININNALKALEDVRLYGEVKNTNDSVIFSKYGDIVIESQNVNLNGLVYAPFGSVTIDAQNLNLNNVVIIAESIVLTCPSVNANNSSNASSFVGKTSDPLDIPYDEWQYMKDENGNNFPDFFEDYDNWLLLKDTDGDRLPDCVEQFLGTDATLVDTDGDMLDDYYEVFVTGTDPTKLDTDDNGIDDGDEDFDGDGLTNSEEYTCKTDPWNEDSDNDGLKDGEEVNTYFTDPLKKDTDDDGLEDGEEIYLADFGFLPTNPDSNGDGILDGDERFEQTIEQDINADDDKISAVTKVSVTFDCPGIIDRHVTLENMYNVDMLSSNVVGMVGAPIDITSEVDFDYATITFTYDEALLNGTPEENLAILWYDEANDRYVILDEDTVVDVENNTVSYTTTHFSTYLVIDREIWYDCWRENIDYRNSSTFKTEYDIGFVVDVSGSMDGDRLNRAKTALNTFIDAMYPCDNACLVKFNSYGNVVSKYGSSISALKSAVSSLYASGGTSTNSGLLEAIDELSPNLSDDKTAMIILICDGDVEYNAATMVLINRAIQNNIAIHTINVCDSASSILSEISEKTGGTYYIAKTSSEIASVMATLQQNTVSSIDMTDSDGDGLYDVYEVNGMKIQNGQIIKTDPNEADSDNDGVSDFDEIGCAPIAEVVKFAQSEYSCVLFKSKSNPWEPDSDGDYYPDSTDDKPNKWKRTLIYDRCIDDTDSAKGKNPVESSYKTNGILTQIIMGDGGTMEKNAYSFIRSNNSKYKHKGYSSTFSIDPKKNSYYAITVTDVNSLDDVEIKVTYVEDGFWFITEDKTITVKQCESATYANGEATFYYYLETGMDNHHIIQINNNSGCSTYNVIVSQDNWVYAPNGGIQDVVEYSDYASNTSAFGGSLPSYKYYISEGMLYAVIADIVGTKQDLSDIKNVEKIMNDLGYDREQYSVTTDDVINVVLSDGALIFSIYSFGTSAAGETIWAALLKDKAATGALAISGILEVRTTPNLNLIKKITNYWEKQGLKEAFDKSCESSGSYNVYRSDYSNLITNFWQPWEETSYINKIDEMGNKCSVYCFNPNDTQLIREKLGWK